MWHHWDSPRAFQSSTDVPVLLLNQPNMTWFGPRTGLTVAKALSPFEKRKTRQNDEVQAQGEERTQ